MEYDWNVSRKNKKDLPVTITLRLWALDSQEQRPRRYLNCIFLSGIEFHWCQDSYWYSDTNTLTGRSSLLIRLLELLLLAVQAINFM